MTDIVERVARAIYEARNGDGQPYMGIILNWPEYLAQARAAIAAMREPTEEMQAAGAEHVRQVSGGMAGIYRAMIDAALGGRDE